MVPEEQSSERTFPLNVGRDLLAEPGTNISEFYDPEAHLLNSS